MKVVLLCAGFATRLFPLTRNQAKPLLEVGGRPVLSWILDRILEIEGVDGIVLVSNHRFARDFRDWAKAVDSRVSIRVVDDGAGDDSEKLGAVADLALVFERCPELCEDEEGLCVVAGDNLIGFSLVPFAEAFRAGSGHLLLVREVPAPVPPGRYSEVVLGDDDRVLRFREKPSVVESPWSCICLYFFRPEVTGQVSEYLRGGSNPDAPGHFLAWLHDRQALSARRVAGSFHDIGNLEQLERARAHFSRDTGDQT